LVTGPEHGDSPVRITHFSTYDLAGGAARAAYRLHTGLRQLGHESHLLVQYQESNDPDVIRFQPPFDISSRLVRGLRRRFLERANKILTSRPSGVSYFTDDRSQHRADMLRQTPSSDILHLHWIANFIDYGKFFRQAPKVAPIVWTLHDMNPFTGGCHFDDGCGAYLNQCGACPQLGSKETQDHSADIWRRKKKAFSGLDASSLHFVAPSRWLADAMQKSALLGRFPVSVIPYGIDTEIFKPRDRQLARLRFRIPPDARVVLFVADNLTDKRKGFGLLLQAIKKLRNVPNLYFIATGRDAAGLDLGKSAMAIEYVKDELTLSQVYSASDLFVIPSLQDNLPLTALEALACGIPTVGFNVGGLPEIVRERETGSLTSAGDVSRLGCRISELLNSPERRASMAEASRRIAVEEYRLELQASRYLELYNSLISGANAS
jgi:glycosyltransferase involved in cell wall biosynthesis